jgi:hypothetical protein
MLFKNNEKEEEGEKMQKRIYRLISSIYKYIKTKTKQNKK